MLLKSVHSNSIIMVLKNFGSVALAALKLPLPFDELFTDNFHVQ